MVQSRPSHPFQLSLRPLLPLPPYRNRLFQANGLLLEHAGRGPPLRVQASFLSEKLHRVRAPADETRAFACKPRSHLSSPGPDGALPCLFRLFLRHHQEYLSACPEAPSVPAHRETLSSHALAGCAILGKLTSLGLGFFHDSEDLPPSPAPRFAARTKSRLTAGAAPASTKPGGAAVLPPRTSPPTPGAGRAEGDSVPGSRGRSGHLPGATRPLGGAGG